MFPPLGLFKEIFCPQGHECSLLTCIFSHPSTNPPSADPRVLVQDAPATREDNAGIIPAPKKAKLQSAVTADHQKDKARDPLPRIFPSEPSSQRTSSNVSSKTSELASKTPAKLHSLTKEVSPPVSRPGSTPTKRGARPSEKPGLPPRNAPRESLNPRMLTKAPAPHGVRLSILTKLHSVMSTLNDKLSRDKDSADKCLVLSHNELVTMALDDEERTARGNASIYSNVIKLRIMKLSKLGLDDWAKEVRAHLNERYYKIAPIQAEQKPKILTTGLSAKEEVALAGKLITPLEGLEEYGYVTRAPTKEEIEAAKKGVVESKGWEKCERCGGRFQVFPGRREDGSLTTGGQCTHHPGKALYPPRKQTDHITGSREAYFTCCNETLGTSSGCTKGPSHVFKVSETKRLASILQFEKTPFQPGKGPQQPVCFDCEMGYTTMGLELIRLTAVRWPDGKDLLDVLVRPIGEVLDLNSRFSGVFPEHYNNAIPYDSSTPADPSTREDPAPLQVVKSPAAARSLLFQLIQPDTPLIGHAIDNDLNACRIIHPTIIDTVLLYPHPRGGLPNRMALKTLSKKHLDRDIQTGGSRGHDSKEDAVATGDLVRVKAAETWTLLKSKGWVIQENRLVPPAGAPDEDTTAPWRLGPGAGQKRTSSMGGSE